MKKLFAVTAALSLGLAMGSAWADRGHDHGYGHGHPSARGRTHVGIYIDPFWGPWNYRPYPYRYPYYPPPPSPVVVLPPAPPPVYIEQAQPPAENVWYYCAERRNYYPYVRDCPGPWQKVPAQPPAQP